MIRKLKCKLIVSIMTIGALMLIVTLGSNYYSSILNLQQQMESSLVEVADRGEVSLASPWNLQQLYIPCFMIDVRLNGSVVASQSDYYALDSQDILLVATTILTLEEASGTLPHLNLRYVISEIPEGIRIVCADLTIETQMQSTLFHNSLMTFFFVMCALLALSFLLVGNMVAPVERAWTAQGQFVADASHELKTPLTVILSSAEMLSARSGEDEDSRRWLDNIEAEGRRMRRLIEDMLTLTRWEETPSIATTVDFSETVNRVIMTFEPLIFEGHRMIEDEIFEGLSLVGDPDRLHQLVTILLDNSLKYSPSESVISVTLSRESSRSLLLCVSNFGDPIPLGQRERLFDRFYRRDKARSGRMGVGLGLSIALDIVRSHHGKIWVECENGEVHFLVRLPLKIWKKR